MTSGEVSSLCRPSIDLVILFGFLLTMRFGRCDSEAMSSGGDMKLGCILFRLPIAAIKANDCFKALELARF